MIWEFLDLSLDREAILNSLSKSARIELEQRLGPNVHRKLGGIIIIFLNLLRLAGTRVRVTINQLSQALSSTRKLAQIGAVTTIMTGCTWKGLGLTLSLLIFLTLVTSLCTVQS